LRNFTLGTKIDEASLASDTAQEKVAECFRGLEPFVGFPKNPKLRVEYPNSRLMKNPGVIS
jgi:hypothetical protein